MYEKKIYIAGHSGMVGSAIVRNLKSKGYKNLLLRKRKKLDLMRQEQVENFFEETKPEIVIIAAAKVGGIYANNTYRAEFLYNNLMIESNIMEAAKKNNVEKLIFLGSSCIYPKKTSQPIKEEYILTGKLEDTNEPYSIVKITGIKLCENYYSQYGCNYYSLMPTNMYGFNDNFHLENSHVIPALIKKMHMAKINNDQEVYIWGTGNATREFLYVDDLADAIEFSIRNIDATNIYESGISQLNVGTGIETSIAELALTIKEVIGYEGKLKFDSSKPDGMHRRVLDVTKINKLGWRYSTDLKNGLQMTYEWFLNNKELRQK